MQKKVKRIIEKVCKQHEIPVDIGVKIVNIPYKMLRDETSKSFGSFNKDDYPQLIIPSFGKFYTRQSKLDSIKKHKELKKAEQKSDKNEN